MSLFPVADMGKRLDSAERDVRAIRDALERHYLLLEKILIAVEKLIDTGA